MGGVVWLTRHPQPWDPDDDGGSGEKRLGYYVTFPRALARGFTTSVQSRRAVGSFPNLGIWEVECLEGEWRERQRTGLGTKDAFTATSESLGGWL